MDIKDKLKELTRHFFIYGLGSIAQSLAGFILLPIITSNLVPEDYGAYTMINLCGILAGTVFYLGITSALPRSYFDYEEEEQRNLTLSTSFYLILAGAILQSFLGFVLGKPVSRFIFGSDQYSVHLFVMLLATAIGFLNTFFQTYFRLLNRSRSVVSLGILASVINVALVYLLLTRYSVGIWAPIYGYLASQAVIFVISLFVVRGTLTLAISTHEAKVLVRFGIPTVITSFAVMGIEWADRLFIDRYLSLSDVGIYSLAYKLGSIISALYVGPFMQIWNPMMMKYRQSDGLQEFFKRVLTYYFLAGAAFLVLFSAVMNELVYLLVKKQEYHQGMMIAPIVMAGALIYGSTNILTAGLFYSRRISTIPVIYAGVAIFNLILNFLLIPKWGYVGAAWSSFLTYLSIPPLIYAASRKHFDFNIEYGRLLALAGMTTLGVGGILFSESLPLVSRLSMKLVVSVCFLVVAIAVSISSRERSKALGLILARKA